MTEEENKIKETENQDKESPLDSPSISKEEFLALKKELDGVRDSKEHLFDIRSIISDEIKLLFSKLKDLKDSRDELTTKVQDMKTERDSINTQIKTLIEEVKGLRDVNGERVNATALKKEVSKMRYYMETNPLSPEEEKKVMKTIRDKEKVLGKSEEVSGAKSKLKDLSKTIDDLKEKSNKIHAEVKELAKVSQEKHEELINFSKDIKYLKAREKEIHALFSDEKDDYKEKRSLYLKNRKFYEAKRPKKEPVNIMKKIERNVEEKIRKGQKITTEDLLAMR